MRGAQRLLRLSPTTYVEQRTPEYRRYWETAARALSAEFVPLASDLWEVRRDGRRTRILNCLVQIDDAVTLELGADKEFAYRIARECGVPVPLQAVFGPRQVKQAQEFVAHAGGVFVVKPARGSSAGMGVTTHVQSAAQLLNAYAVASLFSRNVIVERMIFGETCRLLFLNGECIHAVRRRGVRIRGDGCSTIGRQLGGGRSDHTTVLTLRSQRLDLDSILPAGRDTLVRSLPAGESNAHELRTVYDETITQMLCPELVDEARRVVHGMGTRFAGVDVITTDPTRSLREAGGVFLEINTCPGIHHHYISQADHFDRPVAQQVLEYLLDTAP